MAHGGHPRLPVGKWSIQAPIQRLISTCTLRMYTRSQRVGIRLVAERVSIKVAAECLNVSEVTVKRRIKKGELLAIQDETPQGFVWLVELPDAVEDDDTLDQSASSPPDQSATQPPDHAYAASDQVVTELRGQIVYLKDEIEDRKREHGRDRDDWRDELQRLHTLMGQQGQTLQALTKTVETLETLPATSPAHVPTHQPNKLVRTDATGDLFHRWISTIAAVLSVGTVVVTIIQALRGDWNPSRDLLLYAFTVAQWGSLYGQLFYLQKKNRAEADGNLTRRDHYAKVQDRYSALSVVTFLGVVGTLFFA